MCFEQAAGAARDRPGRFGLPTVVWELKLGLIRGPHAGWLRRLIRPRLDESRLNSSLENRRPLTRGATDSRQGHFAAPLTDLTMLGLKERESFRDGQRTGKQITLTQIAA